MGGKYVDSITEVPCGNIVGLEGIDTCLINTATIGSVDINI